MNRKTLIEVLLLITAVGSVRNRLYIINKAGILYRT